MSKRKPPMHVTVKKSNENASVHRAPVSDIDTLIAGITDENQHREVDFGPPVGREIGSN